MLRLLLAFPVAALVTSTIWYLLVALASSQPMGIGAVWPILWLSMIILCVAAVVGVPIMPLARRYELTSYRQVVGLAVAAVFALVSLYAIVVIVFALLDGDSVQDLFSSIGEKLGRISLDDAMVPVSFLLFAGVISGSFIWAVGVRNNPYFIKELD